jgi:hypothetical protein
MDRLCELVLAALIFVWLIAGMRLLLRRMRQGDLVKRSHWPGSEGRDE